MAYCFLPQNALVLEGGQEDAKFFFRRSKKTQERPTNEPHNPLGKLEEVILHNKINGHMDKYE